MILGEILAALLILAGLLGLFLPALPGTPLIFAGALVYDLVNDWTVFGWGWLTLLLLLTLLALLGDWWLSNMGARKGGASWQALAVGGVLGLIGLIFLPPFGFLLGSIGGVIGTEILRVRDGRRAVRAGSGWLVGWILSLLLQGAVALAMLGLIIWRTW